MKSEGKKREDVVARKDEKIREGRISSGRKKRENKEKEKKRERKRVKKRKKKEKEGK